jgi:predicted phage terminase large subunit-like protein
VAVSPSEPARERAAMRELLTIPHCPQVPTAKQSDFLLDFSREALYGGAAGGGKSSALLMGALQLVETPGYAAIIFRVHLTDLTLPGGLIDRSKSWIGTGARWSREDHTWTFPTGATLSFGYLDSEGDQYRYQGTELHYIAFDELTQFSETQYRYLFSRLRRPRDSDSPLSQVPLRVRAATNPGGPGHDWVRRRFIEPWLARRTDPTVALERRYYPATITDNPHLDRDSYLESLYQLDPVTRAQLAEGNWDIRPDGRLFQRTWFSTERRHALPDILTTVRYWDLAATPKAPGRDPDYTVGVLVGKHRDGTYSLLDIARTQGSPASVETLVRTTAQRDGSDTIIVIEQEPGASGKSIVDHYRRRLLDGYYVVGDVPSGNKVTRAQLIASRAEAGDLTLVTGPWNDAFLDEAEIFPDGAHDDQVDALSGAMAYLAQHNSPVIIPAGFIEANRQLTRRSVFDF